LKKKNSDGKIAIDLLKKPLIWLLIASFFSTTFVTQAITVDLSLFSQDIGYSDIDTGRISTGVSLGLIISCVLSGKISDIFAERSNDKGRSRILALSIGPIVIILSSMMLALLDLSSFTLFYVTAFLFSVGASWGLGTFYAILPELFNGDELPIVTGLLGGAGDMGMPLAPVLVGVLFGMRGMWSAGWGVCAIAALISLFACIILLRARGRVQN
jgi:MFS family permease